MEHKQLLTVFNSLPVGIGFFTADGTLVRCNESFCRIFGADSQTLLGNKLNINENSVVPDVVKEAVRRCVPVQMSFCMILINREPINAFSLRVPGPAI